MSQIFRKLNKYIQKSQISLCDNYDEVEKNIFSHFVKIIYVSNIFFLRATRMAFHSLNMAQMEKFNKI